jgi:hypothetical protein
MTTFENVDLDRPPPAGSVLDYSVFNLVSKKIYQTSLNDTKDMERLFIKPNKDKNNVNA